MNQMLQEQRFAQQDNIFDFSGLRIPASPPVRQAGAT